MIDPIFTGLLVAAFAFLYPAVLRMGGEIIEREMMLLRDEKSREYAMKYLRYGKGRRLLRYSRPVASEKELLGVLSFRFDVWNYTYVRMIAALVIYVASLFLLVGGYWWEIEGMVGFGLFLLVMSLLLTGFVFCATLYDRWTEYKAEAEYLLREMGGTPAPEVMQREYDEWAEKWWSRVKAWFRSQFLPPS